MSPATAVLLLLFFCGHALVADSQSVYSPPAALTTNAFVGANESFFQYPEATPGSNYSMPSVTSRPSFGIALSGGGMRAATTGLGYLRGLHQMGVTSGARYLTSNSGGSWLNTAFSFQQKYPITQFLGNFTPPDQLSLSALNTPAPAETFEAAIANAQLLAPGVLDVVQNAAQNIKPGRQQDVGAWSTDVGRAFLQPFDLNSDAATFTATGTAGPVHQALQGLGNGVTVYQYKPYSPAGNNTPGDAQTNPNSSYRPYPIMMGAILLQNTPMGFYPFEFTPLYVGIAPYFNDTTPPVGGGYVDPVAFNSPAPQPPPPLPPALLAAFAATNVTGFDNGTLLTATNASSAPQDAAGNSGTGAAAAAAAAGTPNASGSPGGSSNNIITELLSLSVKPDYLVPLKVITGISSSFITNMVRPGGVISQELTGTETLQYWSPINFSSMTVPFADGGSADNLAITPLLRRRVTKIVALVAAERSITDVQDANDWAGYQYDVSGLFGAAPPSHPSYDKGGTITGVPPDLFNRKLQVFPKAAFAQLYDELNRTTAAGGPVYHLANYTVVTNNHQAIFGGWQVEVLWVVNQRQTQWESALPQETADLLNAGRSNSPNALDRLKGLAGSVLGSGSLQNPSTLGLKNFPYISTGLANYSPQLTRLLSQQSNWQVLQLRPQLEQLLRGTNVTVGPAA